MIEAVRGKKYATLIIIAVSSLSLVEKKTLTFRLPVCPGSIVTNDGSVLMLFVSRILF